MKLDKSLEDLDTLRSIVNKFKSLYHVGAECSNKELESYLDFLVEKH